MDCDTIKHYLNTTQLHADLAWQAIQEGNSKLAFAEMEAMERSAFLAKRELGPVGA